MTPLRRLRRLERSAVHQLERLRVILATALQSTDYRARDRIASHVAIELLNCWTNFARAYYLSCVVEARRSHGGRIAVSRKCAGWAFRDALANSIALIKGWQPQQTFTRRDEPAWHDPNNLLTLLGDIGATNLPTAQAALSAGQTVFRDLPAFRNYFGHRNESTRLSAMRLAAGHGIPGPKSPAEIVLARAIGRPQPILADWLDEVRFTIEMLCW